jgi:hypothetical protein
MLVIVLELAGCASDSGPGAARVAGLTPDATVTAFFNAAKLGRGREAALYVSPVTRNDVSTVLKYMTGHNGIGRLTNANLLSVKIIAAQGNYAAVVATLQPDADSTALLVRPVGLEKIDGEWYIVDNDQIVKAAKYLLLKHLLSEIKV